MTTKIATRTVTFTYGTCKDAALKIPAKGQPASLRDIIDLIRSSYLEYMFSSPILMSDEVLVSSIGRNHFFAGALGGWKLRLEAKAFETLEMLASNNAVLAVRVAQYRDSNLTFDEAREIAKKNKALNKVEKWSLGFMQSDFEG